MQTCSICHIQSPDSMVNCPTCHSLLRETSEQAVALKKFQDNPRLKILRVAAFEDCCPACRAVEGNYDKKEAPILPVIGCSHANGCRCFYEPILTEIFP